MSVVQSMNCYLYFPGDAEEAFKTYRSVFGGEYSALVRYRDVQGQTYPPEVHEKLMHVSLPLGEGIEIMGSDVLESLGHKITVGNNFSIALTVSSRAEADRIYAGLIDGGVSASAMKEEFWGAYFGMLTDRFGVQWMISAA